MTMSNGRRAATCGARRTGRICALALLTAALSGTARAHEGHDHGGDKAALEIVSLSRASAVSEAYQAVAILDAGTLLVSLDHLESNAPVERASLSILIGNETRAATLRPDGIHTVAAPELARPGRHELVITVTVGESSDLLITAVDVPAVAAGQIKPRIVADTPARLTDGSVFMPKITQRLLGLRTVAAQRQSVEPAYPMVGRVIADPNRSGVVQSTIAGRIKPTDGRLPRLGENVTSGQVLAVVAPAYAAIDITNVQQTAGDLDQQIALAQNKVDQFRPLVHSKTFPIERLRVVEIELENLHKRRAALSTSQRGSEPLLAPVDGVIAAMRAVPGQVVAPQDVLFQIVDPKSLWIEALVFDPAVPDLLAEATATVPGRAPLDLRLIGRSRALQQLSTVVHFAITEPPASLNIGSPVTVLARTRERVSGLILPRASIVGTPSGGRVVWVQTEPERFQARAVTSRPIDGERVVVDAGIEAGERVVSTSAELINQVR